MFAFGVWLLAFLLFACLLVVCLWFDLRLRGSFLGLAWLVCLAYFRGLCCCCGFVVFYVCLGFVLQLLVLGGLVQWFCGLSWFLVALVALILVYCFLWCLLVAISFPGFGLLFVCGFWLGLLVG